MNDSQRRDEFARAELDRYRRQIPRQLWDLLVPPEGPAAGEFAVALKRLRIREQERNYVMSIQRRFGIAIRPNESVKESMTRVRVKLIQGSSTGDQAGLDGKLPQDPLE